ncbi:MAG: MFS transporter [Calditrichaeota bacterium]|nr:MFS transporter [Calditrichota bacterium]
MYKKAQSNYLWFSKINAISYASLADAVLILYAIRIGADDFLVGLVISFLYLTMPFMLLGKQWIAEQGAAKTFFRSWVFRNISALFLFFVPIVQKHINPVSGLFLFVIASFGFFAFRSIGITAILPLIRDITSAENRGQFISKTWFQSMVFYLFAMVAIVALTSRYQTVTVFQAIVILGSLAGVVASLFMKKVPESDKPKLSAQRPLLESIRFISNNIAIKKLLTSWSLSTAALMLVTPFSMVALKNGFQISDHSALLFSIIQITGGILASYMNTLMLDRVGPRPMIIIYSFGILIIAILWMTAPANFFWPVFLLIFLLAGACNAGINTALSHYLLGSVPTDLTVGISMLMAIISGVVAGISGTILGGGLLRFLRAFDLLGLMVYRIYFAIIFIYLIIVIIMNSKLQPLSDRRVKDVLGIFFSPRDWRALFVLQKIYGTKTIGQDERIIDKLGQIGSDLSRETLSNYLDSPSFITRSRAIRALGRIEIEGETVQKLLNEIKEGEHTTAFWAAEVLGEQHIKSAIPVLRNALDSDDIPLKGKTMLALARLGDEPSYQKIIDIFTATENPRLIIHGAKAFVNMKQTKLLQLLIHKVTFTPLSAKIRDEVLYCMCEMCSAAHLFYRLYPDMRKNNSAVLWHLDEFIRHFKSRDESTYRNLVQIKDILLKSEKAAVLYQQLFELKDELEKRDCPRQIFHFIKTYPEAVFPVETRYAFLLIIISTHHRT